MNKWTSLWQNCHKTWMVCAKHLLQHTYWTWMKGRKKCQKKRIVASSPGKLLCLCRRTHQDMQSAMAFLCTRVQAPGVETAAFKTSANLDLDLYKIAINSCCTYSIARFKRDFVETIKWFNMRMQDLNGDSIVKWKGTWKFDLVDDNGVSRII